MDGLLSSIVENVHNAIDQFGDYTGIKPSEEQRINSEVSILCDKICAREDVQNLLTKYRLQLFQVREVNEEVIRRANKCSTRMGRAQQIINGYVDQTDKMEKHLSPKALNGLTAQLEEIARQMKELERHTLQAELAMAELERLNEGRRKDAELEAGKRGENASQQEKHQRRAGSEEELLPQAADEGQQQ